MAKISLGARPKNFKHTVAVDLLDGTKGTIECTFRYRTRREFGAFIDGLTAAAKEAGQRAEAQAKKADEGDEKTFSLAEFHGKTIDANADYILQILDSWNLDVELSREAIEQLADELPGASTAIVEAYRVAITEGRLGN